MSQNPCNLLQQRFHLILSLDKHLLHLNGFPLFFLHHGIDIKAIALVGRNPARRSMGLKDITHLLQIRHLISDRC